MFLPFSVSACASGPFTERSQPVVPFPHTWCDPSDIRTRGGIRSVTVAIIETYYKHRKTSIDTAHEVYSGILLGAAAVFAADFVTGQAARAVIGQQQSFTAANPNSSNTVIGGASGIAYAADTLFIADANRIGAAPNNHRVLIFPNLSGQVPAAHRPGADNSLSGVRRERPAWFSGRPISPPRRSTLTRNSSNIRLPTAVASDGVHLVVADTNHNRVLIWNRDSQDQQHSRRRGGGAAGFSRSSGCPPATSQRQDA